MAPRGHINEAIKDWVVILEIGCSHGYISLDGNQALSIEVDLYDQIFGTKY